VFHIFGALAAGKAAGEKKLGDKQRATAVDLYRQKKHTIDEICTGLGISRPTLFKYVAPAGGR
jgi:transposase-like protein